MLAKKTDKGDLENKRGIFILVGLCIVLGLVYAGFELFASEDKAPAFTVADDDFIEVKDEDVIATDQTPPLHQNNLQHNRKSSSTSWKTTSRSPQISTSARTSTKMMLLKTLLTKL